MQNFKPMEISDFKEIINTIQEVEGVELNVTKSIMGNNIYMFSMEQETELYIKKSLNNIIISKVNFKNKRQGLMTKILNELIKITKDYDYDTIMVESVLTKEMSNFCLKHNFIQKPNYFGEYDSYLGDYELKLKED